MLFWENIRRGLFLRMFSTYPDSIYRHVVSIVIQLIYCYFRSRFLFNKTIFCVHHLCKQLYFSLLSLGGTSLPYVLLPHIISTYPLLAYRTRWQFYIRYELHCIKNDRDILIYDVNRLLSTLYESSFRKQVVLREINEIFVSSLCWRD